MEKTATGAGRLAPAEQEWVRKARTLGWKADIAECARLCTACPESFRGSADFAFWTGWCTGRMTQLDRVLEEQSPEREKELSDAQDAIYAAAERFTRFNPAVFCCAAAYIAPAAVFSLFGDEVWPEGLRSFRPFWMGWFLGQFQEGEQTARNLFATEGVKSLFFQLLGSHRRPGGGPSVI